MPLLLVSGDTGYILSKLRDMVVERGQNRRTSTRPLGRIFVHLLMRTKLEPKPSFAQSHHDSLASEAGSKER